MARSNTTKAQKPSKVVKPKKSKRHDTPSTKNHRFQPFSERIANLKIDPIRRRRKVEDREELSEDTAAYFGRSFEEWRDLNLSQTFTSFAREVAPFCDSLPVVLYNEEKIMDLLVTYIEKGDGLALEPLLNLLSHFAHDLDARFEKHFQRAVATVTEVASKHTDPAVVEWSFTCLAWLFKYLSRLLVSDLRLLYDLMAPYLGREPQRPFIIRFAAESLSFLLRKAAATYGKDSKPLDLIINHIFEDCKGYRQRGTMSLHRQGVMTLFTEAVIGVQNDVHSSGLAIIRSMLKEIEGVDDAENEAIAGIISGVLTSLIHHANAETFKPIQDCVLQAINTSDKHLIRFGSQLIFTMVSVRKGSRISDWKRLVHTTTEIVANHEDSLGLDAATTESILGSLAVVLQTATIDAVLPTLRTLEMLRHGPWDLHFLQFCDLFLRLGHDRFKDFLLPQLQKFINEQWQDHEDAVFLLLPRLANQGQTLRLSCPESLQSAVVKQLGQLSIGSKICISLDDLSATNSRLAALPLLKLSVKKYRELTTVMLSSIKSALTDVDGTTEGFNNFILGPCFASLLDNIEDSTPMAELWPALCCESHRFIHLSGFWSNLNRYIETYKSHPMLSESVHMATLEDSLLQCLPMACHTIRQSALDIIQSLYRLRPKGVPAVISAAIIIESTPVNLETSRTISMNIRRLASGYSEASHDAFIQKAIPSYCFGILHFQLSQAWSDASNALDEMSKTNVGEEVITSIAQKWLDSVQEHSKPANEEPAAVLTFESDGFKATSDFECPNLMKISAICHQVFQTPESGYHSAQDQFLTNVRPIPPISANAREQALKVLNKLPSLAEKRSRMLVPVLLRWSGDADSENGEDNTNSALRWTRKDQKSMLNIFAQFSNPKVLYKSAEVYGALLNLCANGDTEIQRAALKALLAWKDPAINQYEENLVNLLDEVRFREELSVFLQNHSDDESAIQPEHHERLMPVLLRLLYGRAVAGGKYGKDSRRKAIFVALSRFDNNVLGLFIDITLGSTSNAHLLDGDKLNEQAITERRLPLRQQFGMLNMLDDMLETLGTELQPFAMQLVNSVLLCSIAASRRINDTTSSDELPDASLVRTVRQTGIQCLVKIFSTLSESLNQDYVEIIVNELIGPRLGRFAQENTQSVSGILRLVSAWTTSEQMAQYVVECQADLLIHIAELLREPSTKDGVRLFILKNILDNVLLEDTSHSLQQPQATSFVESVRHVLDQQPSKDVLDACVASFTRLSSYIHSAQDAENIVAVCTMLLTKPNKMVSPTTKTGLLKTIMPLLTNFEISARSKLFVALCGLFSRLQDPDSRVLLSNVLVEVCRSDAHLSEVAEICSNLNALGHGLDQVDHESREAGFMQIYDKHTDFSVQQWQPIVHNCLFFIRDADDMVNRSSASQALQKFVDTASQGTVDFKPLITETLLPGIEYGVKEKSELVRIEYLRLLGQLVEAFPQWHAINDMSSLTVGGDDEASVFVNILHIQQHRRLRALRRLSEEASKISSGHVTRIFLPLLEHFIFDQAEGDAGRTLTDQAVATIGALAVALKWSAFRATFRRYSAYLGQEEFEKVSLRLLGALVDALSSQSDALDKEGLAGSKLPDRTEIITRDFLPPLTEYVHHKDESTVDRRIPVAVTIVKLQLLLPESEMSSRLAPLLSDVCHVLRSRSQEARDQTRKALAAILSLVGPSYLGFILKELRGALKRGYQLHVLSFTVHSLLVNAVDTYEPGDLNECLAELVTVVMDDIFGVTGQEKDAEEYKSGMKEVKSSKSFDTMELLARVAPVHRLAQLIRPVRSLLLERLDAKMLKKVDDLLTRIRKGVDSNPASDSREMLMFCHEIVRGVHAEQTDVVGKEKYLQGKHDRYLIRQDPSNKSQGKSTTTSRVFKLASFALNLLRKVIRRHEDLMTPSNMSGFLPMAGDALVQGQEDVKLSAIRLLSTVMKLNIPELDSNAPTYVKEAVRLIKTAPSMTTDSAKAAFELVTSVLREKRAARVSEKDIADVLKSLKGSIDEPDRQGMIYKFLRAVLGRKIMATEVYEIMDEVGNVLVTNPDYNVRESARSVYLQFVLEYPQGKDRWNKQAAFFVENLKYDRPAGRQSIMELLHQLLSRLQDETVTQLGFTFFVALVPVYVGDVDLSCQQMAGLLLTKLFERADEDQMNNFLALMEKWLQSEKNRSIQIASLKCWMILLRAKAPSVKRMALLRDTVQQMLEDNTLQQASSAMDLVKIALKAFDVIIDIAPELGYGKSSSGVWDCIRAQLTSEDTEIQEIAARLQEAFFSNLASTSAKTGVGLSAIPLFSSGGIEFHAEDMRSLCHGSLKALRSRPDRLSETLSSQTGRNLIFLGRCFAANELTWQPEATPHSDDDIDVEEPDSHKNPSALAYLFNRLSYIIRQDKLPTISRKVAIRCQASLLGHVPAIPDIESLMRPLYLLTDPAIPQPPDDEHKDLVNDARELLDGIQKKIGGEDYVSALGAVRADATARREDRRQKRRIDAVSAPERWAREKRKKYEAKKTKVKAKGMEARGRRRGW